MLNLFSNTSLDQPASKPASNGVIKPEALTIEADGDVGTNGSSFTELLNAKISMAGVMEELKGLLSAEDFMALEGLLAEGEVLPLAEIVAALRQQLSDLDTEQVAPQLLKLSDVLPDLVAVTGETTEQVATLSATEITDSAVRRLATLSATEITDSAAEQAAISLIAGQTIVPIATSEVKVSVSMAADQAVVKAANGENRQPIVTGQAVAPSNAEDDAPGLPSNMGGSSANSGQQTPAEQFRMTEAIAAQIAQKTPVNNIFRTTEAGLAPVNNIVAAPPGLPLQNAVQTTVLNQLNAQPIHIPMGEKGWDQAVGERMLWMVGRQIQGAEVRITPPQLGPIDIRISIQNDHQASVTFAAQHGVVRDALEASIPRLREMLSENNLQLVNVDVNQRNNSEQRSSHFFNRSSSGEQDSEGYEFEEGEAIENRMLTIQSNGLVDDFA